MRDVPFQKQYRGTIENCVLHHIFRYLQLFSEFVSGIDCHFTISVSFLIVRLCQSLRFHSNSYIYRIFGDGSVPIPASDILKWNILTESPVLKMPFYYSSPGAYPFLHVNSLIYKFLFNVSLDIIISSSMPWRVVIIDSHFKGIS